MTSNVQTVYSELVTIVRNSNPNYSNEDKVIIDNDILQYALIHGIENTPISNSQGYWDPQIKFAGDVKLGNENDNIYFDAQWNIGYSRQHGPFMEGNVGGDLGFVRGKFGSDVTEVGLQIKTKKGLSYGASLDLEDEAAKFLFGLDTKKLSYKSAFSFQDGTFEEVAGHLAIDLIPPIVDGVSQDELSLRPELAGSLKYEADTIHGYADPRYFGSGVGVFEIDDYGHTIDVFGRISSEVIDYLGPGTSFSQARNQFLESVRTNVIDDKLSLSQSLATNVLIYKNDEAGNFNPNNVTINDVKDFVKGEFDPENSQDPSVQNITDRETIKREFIEELESALFIKESSDQSSSIRNSQEVSLLWTDENGDVTEIILDPEARRIEQFYSEFADANVNGIIIAQNTDTITRSDGSVVNVTETLFESYGGERYTEISTALVSGSVIPANGVFSETVIAKENGGYSRTTKFEKDGLTHQTQEFQETPDSNITLKQNILRPDGNGGFIEEDGPIYVVPSSELLYALESIGSTAGGLLANHLADDNVYQQVFYSALFQTLGKHFGSVAAYLATGSNIEALGNVFKGAEVDQDALESLQLTDDIFDTFTINLQAATASVLAGAIVGEVGEAIGLEDSISGDVFNIVGNSLVTPIIQNQLGTVFNFVGFAGAPNVPTILDANYSFQDFQVNVLTAVGRYVGGKLSSSIIDSDSAQAAKITTALNAIDSILAAPYIAGSGPFAPLTAAVFTFFSNIRNTFIGNLFGGDDDLPQAWARVDYNANTKQYSVVGEWGSDGGDASVAYSMAEQVIKGINDIIEASHGKLRLGSAPPKIQIGYEGNEMKVIYGGDVKTFGTSVDAIQYAAFKMMKEFDLVGGHMVIMRAWHNSDAKNIQEWVEDIQVAEAFQLYLSNPASVLAVMVDQPESDMAKSWATILQRAEELKLHLPHEKDLEGGWGEILLAQGVPIDFIPDLSGDTLTVIDPITGVETVMHHVIGPGYEIVRIEGTDGNDIIEVVVNEPSISYVDAGPGDDVIEGSDQADILFGGSGDDTINGYEGNDWLHGGAGNDTLDGGAGEDLVVGGEQNDILYGDTETDQLYGNGGDDYLYGNDGRDFLYGGYGNDVLNGGAGVKDYLYGEEGDDVLQANDDDWLFGGKGNDTYQLGEDSGAHVRINRGDGHDIVELSTGSHGIYFQAGISINELFFTRNDNDLRVRILGEDQSVLLKNFYQAGVHAQLYAGGGYFTLNYINNSTKSQSSIIASYDQGLVNSLDTSHNVLTDAALAARSDWIKNNHGYMHKNIRPDDFTNDAYFYTSGDDDIVFRSAASWTKRIYYAGAGDDIIAPSDYFYNGLSFQIYGDSGNDQLYGASAGDVIVGGLGNDSLYGRSGDDRLFGSHGDDYIRASNGYDHVEGGAGNDVIEGGNHDDDIYGGEGDDILDGEQGIDLIKGGAGDDVISGGGENDTAYGDDGNDQVSGDGGNDTLFGNAGNDTINGGEGDDWVSGGEGDDILAGDDGDDVVDGGDGNDILLGGAGNDTLSGDGGDDVVDGGAGDDILNGGSGNDILSATSGNNILLGGEGNDTYSILPSIERPKPGINFNLNGTNGYGVLSNASIGINNMTVSLTYQHSAPGHFDDLLFQYAVPGTKNEFKLSLNPSQSLSIKIADNLYKVFHDFNDTEEHNFVVSWDGDNGIVNFYDNGELLQSFTGAYTGTLDDEGTISLAHPQSSVGVIQSGYEFSGKISELTIWDRPVSATEMLVGPDKSDALHDFDFTDESQSGVLVNKTNNGDMALLGDHAWDSEEAAPLPPSIGFNEDGHSDGYGVLTNAPVGIDNMTVALSYQFSENSTFNDLLFQYAVPGNKNEFKISTNTISGVVIVIGGKPYKTYYNIKNQQEHDMVVSWDGDNGVVRFYDNGELIKTFTNTFKGSLDEGGVITVARAQSSVGVVQTGNDFNGKISDLAVWDRAVDTNEVTNGLNRSDALHDFDFGDNSQPDILVNKTGNGDLQLSGDYERHNINGDEAVQPDSYLSLNQSGADGRIEIENIDMPNNDITVSVTFRTSDNNSGLMSYNASGSQYHFMIYNGPFGLDFHLDGGYFATGHVVADGDWHNLTMSWDQNTGELRAYDNGTLFYTGVRTVSGLDDGGVLTIGHDDAWTSPGWSDTDPFIGDIEQFAIWDHVIDEAEIIGGLNYDDAMHHTVFDQTTSIEQVLGDAAWVAPEAPDINIISDVSGSDTLHIEGQFDSDDLILQKAPDNNNDVIVTVLDLDIARIQNYFTVGAIETVTFDNGSAQAMQDLNVMINGSDGNDVLIGTAQNDIFFGDAGADIFVFNAADGQDIVEDFSLAEDDKFDVSNVIYGYDPINDTISDFIEINNNGQDTIVSIDVDGGGDNFVQIATLKNVTNLSDENTLEASGNLIVS